MTGKTIFAQLLKATAFGICIGLFGVIASLTPAGAWLEVEFGFEWLFRLRGVEQPPPEVAIVSIDKASAQTLNLPDEADRWPRALHGRLIATLDRLGARLIAFDMLFDLPRDPDGTELMAQAMRASGRVLLADNIKPRAINSTLYVESLVSPVPPLANAALTSAPFPLPKADANVQRFWTFWAGAGGRATLPTAALHLFVLDQIYAPFRRVLQRAGASAAVDPPAEKRAIFHGHELHRLVDRLRTWSMHTPRALRRLHSSVDEEGLPQGVADRLHACFALYDGGDIHYYNHYGPPRSIPTIPYHQIINHSLRDPNAVRDKVVFVGRSEDLQPEADRGFFTIFSTPQNTNISSVELAATAFANLLTNRTIRPLALPDRLLLLFFWGLLFGLIGFQLTIRRATPTLVALNLAYLAVAIIQFQWQHLWMPLAIPLGLQFPVGFVALLLLGYSASNRQRNNIHRALSHYIPEEVANQLANRMHTRALAENGRLMHGVCLATDAGNYTSLAESTEPMTLARMMNAYYSAIFEPVRRHGGIVSDVLGDAMLAIWATPQTDETTRNHACEAALELLAAVDQFNREHRQQLPTRVGLHYGPMRLGNVGSSDHYEYRAVGDIVNSATRIEGLNKLLGTRILLSHACLPATNAFCTRELGVFLLQGKSQNLVVHELLCRHEDMTPQLQALRDRFSEALGLFEAHRWNEAFRRFSLLQIDYPNDGPSLFYLQLCRRRIASPPSDASANVINVGKNTSILAS